MVVWVVLADERSKSQFSIYNCSLLRSVSVSFQLCSAPYPSLTAVLCLINMLVYPFLLREGETGFLSRSFQTGICVPAPWLLTLLLIFSFFSNSCGNDRDCFYVPGICEQTGAVACLNPADTSAFPSHPLNWNST